MDTRIRMSLDDLTNMEKDFHAITTTNVETRISNFYSQVGKYTACVKYEFG